MAASSFTNQEYFTKIASIQQSLHEREKRRLELEKELFSYSMSDKRISQIKSAKLRSYLQEICERETRAKMRNLELLRDADSIETRMKEQARDCAPLHRKKAECMNQITRFMTARKDKELKEYGMKEVEGAREKTQDASSSARRPAAVIFRDSHGGGGGSSVTRVHSVRAARGSPGRLAAHSPERLPSGLLLKDSKVSGEEAAADRAARLSDDISGSNGSPGGSSCGLSDGHERRRRAPVLLPSACALTDAAAAVPFRACGGERPLSPPVTLTLRPERNISSSGGGSGDATSPVWAEKSGARDAPHPPQPAAEEEERGPSRSGRRGSEVSTDSSSVLVSSDSDLSISLTESESELDHDEEEEPPEGVAHLDTPPGVRVTPERSASSPPPPDDQSLRCREEESSVQESKKPLQFMCDSTTPTESMTERLSHQGLVRLLESIEGRLRDGAGQVHVYQNAPAALHAGKRNHVISLCNSGSAALNAEDLETCGAVVLAELPRLSRSTASGALLTQDLVSVSAARRSDVRREDISASLPPDGAALWDRWFEHALVLKERRVLTAERLALLFTPLLLERHAACGQQARELLRTLLSRSDEEEDEEESDSSSPSHRLPSLHPDDKEGTATSHHPWPTGGPPRATWGPHPHSMRPAELQSSEEDSRNQSPAESIPIRETKAYQLLKQSATQERARSSGEQEEKSAPSGINGGDEEDLHSSHQDPPQPREETTNSKRFSAIQSKAFWGESDDSDSEIEAALRPQTFNTNDVDDFDDFYD